MNTGSRKLLDEYNRIQSLKEENLASLVSFNPCNNHAIANSPLDPLVSNNFDGTVNVRGGDANAGKFA